MTGNTRNNHRPLSSLSRVLINLPQKNKVIFAFSTARGTEPGHPGLRPCLSNLVGILIEPLSIC